MSSDYKPFPSDYVERINKKDDEIVQRMESSQGDRTVNDSQGEGATKTSIMYKSYLSFAQLSEYLSLLLENGLIDEIPKHTGSNSNIQKNVYKITGRGLRLLQILQEMENLVGLDCIPYSKRKSLNNSVFLT